MLSCLTWLPAGRESGGKTEDTHKVTLRRATPQQSQAAQLRAHRDRPHRDRPLRGACGSGLGPCVAGSSAWATQAHARGRAGASAQTCCG